MKRKIILASTSPIRRQMLEEFGVEFDAQKPIADEDELKGEIKHLPILQQSLELAKYKALDISKQNPEAYVIGSDQICEIDGEIISKSKDEADAFNSLKKLQGKTHSQNNGTCILLNGDCVFENKESVKLTMKPLSDAEIQNYIALDNPIGCAGSYKFELNGKTLFSKIQGSEECIKGFTASKVIDFIFN